MQCNLGEFTESIYRAALDPDAWADVMTLMKRRFRSSAETFYFLDFEPRHVRTVHLSGVSDAWLRRFDELYFTPDNPWVVHTKALHRPGVIRTNERLARYTRDPNVLYRSCYYNEWMRPQDFKHTIGNTLLAENGTVANVTLLRAPDMPAFDRGDVRDFGMLSRHFKRALDVAMRLETVATQRDRSWQAFDELDHGLAIVDRRGRLQYANRAAEALVRRGDALTLCDGQLRTALPHEQPRLDAMLRGSLSDPAPGCVAEQATLALECRRGAGALRINAMRVCGGRRFYLAGGDSILLSICDPERSADRAGDRLREVYSMTRAEARLARELLEGSSLREAAGRIGITYGTARGYLKVLFQKTGTHRQAQLVAHLLRGASTAH